MTPRLYPVALSEFKGRLAITRRPRGFEFLAADVANWRAAGIDSIISMLEEGEASEIGLEDEGAACMAQGLRFVSAPVTDFGLPAAIAAIEPVIVQLAGELKAGRYLAFHCFASVGRSPLLAAATLVNAGLSADTALARLSTARGMRVPETEAQTQWVYYYESHLRGQG